jgi:hypothetical protein
MRGIIRVTRSRISSRDRLATGCSVTTYGYPGKPYDRAIASAASRNGSVQMLTAGMPARSSRIPSARLAALHEPQSPTAVTAKLQVATMRSTWVCSTGVPK